jgi:hypothetical protein
LAREARSRRSVRWDVDSAVVLGAQPPTVILPEFNQARELANVLRDAALLTHARGDDQAAIDRTIDLERLADATDHLVPTLVCHLVSIGMHAMAADTAVRIAPDLAIAKSAPAGNGGAARPASPQQVRQLIDAFLDDRSYTDGWRRAILGERVLGMQMLKGTGAGARWSGFQQLAANDMIDWYTPVSTAATQPSSVAAQSAIRAAQSSAGGASPVGSRLLQVLAPSISRAVVTQYRGLTDRHLAAAALGFRQFALEHNGRLPTTLPDLTPQYLRVAPTDGLADDGSLLQYRPEASPPIVYSVGEDGSDDGGSTKVFRGGREIVTPQGAASGSRWEMEDAIVVLTRQPRRPAPSPTTQPD